MDLKLKKYTHNKNIIKHHNFTKRILSSRFIRGYTTNNLKSIYKLTTTNTVRTKIGVIQLGGGYRSYDLNNFWKYLRLNTTPIINNIYVDGAKNKPGFSDDDDEVYLDIEILGGMCPNSIINVYFAPNSVSSFYNAINKAIQDRNQIISISWGITEDALSSYILNKFDTLFEYAVSLGITICVASGDYGAKDNGVSLSVDFPSSSPHVLSVGGTTLISKNNRYDENTIETTWVGSGGGYSTFFQKPSYQNNINITDYRAIPDVCAVADPNTGYIIYQFGYFYVIGGTSGAAPLWAGFLASINFRGIIHNQLYSYNNIFNDIIQGDNNGYTAGIYYDLCTGLGSPNFSKIQAILLKSQSKK